MARLRAAPWAAQGALGPVLDAYPERACDLPATVTKLIRFRRTATSVDKSVTLCRNADITLNGGRSMTDRSSRALTLGVSSHRTALAQARRSPGSATQPPAPGTNATNVTAAPPKVQRRRTGRSPTRPRSSSPRQSARRTFRMSRRASSRSGRAGSTSSTSRTSKNIPSSSPRSATTTRSQAARSSICAASPPAATAITPARCLRSASISTSSR